MKSLLIIGYVWPEPNSSAAGSRMLQLIDFFIANKYAVTFATTAAETPHRFNLEDLGVEIKKIQLNNPNFDDFVKGLQPDVVLFDRFMMEEQFGWRISEVCPQALKILDTEDLHFLRKEREKAFKNGISPEKNIFESNLAKREIASIYRCDLSLIISEFEMELLQKKFQVPGFLLFYLPFLISFPSKEKINELPSFEQRQHFVSIGNFRHAPNWNAILNLKENIWPIIRKELPLAELHIYGAYPPEKAFQLQQPEDGFLVKGWANSAAEVLKDARLLLAPLRFGAGLKGKFIDAMQHGTPSATTSIGAEGMYGKLPYGGIIEDETSHFAHAAISLFSNKANWQKAQENGFQILEKRYSKIQHQQRFRERMDEMLNTLKMHREKNFTGAMLSHHNLQSTKYLSKYIEMKNKWEKLKK